MNSVFVNMGESYGIGSINRIFSTLEEAKAYGGDWIQEWPVDKDSPAIRSWSRNMHDPNDRWFERDLEGIL